MVENFRKIQEKLGKGVQVDKVYTNCIVLSLSSVTLSGQKHSVSMLGSCTVWNRNDRIGGSYFVFVIFQKSL